MNTQIVNKNIKDALNKQRPNDKVLKILSNKFAIIQAMYTNGTFENSQIVGLQNDTIYFYGYLNTIENFYTNFIETKNNKYEYTHYNNNVCKRKFIKHNKSKSQYIKVLKLLKSI